MTDLEYWLAFNKLWLLPRVALKLLQHFGSPKAVFSASRESLEQVEGITRSTVEKILQFGLKLDVNKELQIMQSLRAKLITLNDPQYPKNLKNIADPPPAFFLRGELKPEDNFAISIVGSRSATPYGKIVSEKLSKELAQCGLTVISGLARGIDTAAHRGALEAGGRTIGVLGCGIDVPYPRENKDLIEEIAQKGAIISEFPLSSPPVAWHFPARNRVISGLALGVLVVEAPETSGALITAFFAAEQGREVFAVPGNVNIRQNRGTHKLIKEGAKLVEDVQDILEELNVPAEVVKARELARPEEPLPKLLPEEQKIFALLSLQQKPIENITYESALPASQVLSALMTLEIKGLVKRLPGNQFIRVK